MVRRCLRRGVGGRSSPQARSPDWRQGCPVPWRRQDQLLQPQGHSVYGHWHPRSHWHTGGPGSLRQPGGPRSHPYWLGIRCCHPRANRHARTGQAEGPHTGRDYRRIRGHRPESADFSGSAPDQRIAARTVVGDSPGGGAQRTLENHGSVRKSLAGHHRLCRGHQPGRARGRVADSASAAAAGSGDSLGYRGFARPHRGIARDRMHSDGHSGLPARDPGRSGRHRGS
eukprot:TRINITY_DN8015_c0_g1_i2.p1 TRINITY_DN8015_c0_g1~~TRINITY_DN8015_c0_g1_i2.p1  ORF type:complete len:227 (+),score=-31.77 TRINITY_DN8015_c0_g1_i2:406-1086(+)